MICIKCVSGDYRDVVFPLVPDVTLDAERDVKAHIKKLHKDHSSGFILVWEKDASQLLDIVVL